MSMNTPKIIDELSYEEIRNQLIQYLQDQLPDYQVLESDPAIKVIEAVSYRETVLRKRINDVAKSNILSFSEGDSLDALGDFHGVQRLDNEDDERYRQRIRLFISGGYGGGTSDYYRYHALSLTNRVKDVVLYRKNKSPIIYAAIFANSSTGGADDTLITEVSNHLNSAAIKMTTDTISVHSAVQIEIDIKATIEASNNALVDLSNQIDTNIRREWAKIQAIGKNITQSWLISKMMIQGIENVKIIAPKQDIIVEPYQAAAIRNVVIDIGTEGM